MIHTTQLLIPIQPKHIQTRKFRYGNPVDENNAINEIIYFSKIEGVTGKEYFSDTQNKWICSLIVDIPKILNRGDVHENDYIIIKQFLEDLLGGIYGDSTLFDEHNLIRLDYRIDVEVPNLNLHYLYLKLYGKTREKYNRLVKNPHEDFETSIYHSCNSIETILYSKTLEAISKNRKLNYWEVNMMRFEVRLKNSHLYYHCRKNHLEKKLITFLKKINLIFI